MSAARLLALFPILLAPRLALGQYEDQKLTSNPAVQNGRFGGVIDADLGRAIVGAGGIGGPVVFLEETGGVWEQVAGCPAPGEVCDPHYGFSVALAGDYAAVGVPSLGATNEEPSSAYVFERQAGVWTEVAHITPSDNEQGNEFGYSVAMAGSTLMVGAPKAGPISLAGAVYVFERIGGTWVETQKLVASNGAFSDVFGTTLDLDGTTAVVGAPLEDNSGGNQAGRVYVFEHDGSSWVEVQKIKEQEAESSGEFGHAVALDGDRLLVSSEMNEVFVLERDGGPFQFQDRLIPDPNSSSSGFGDRVAVSGDHALIGAPRSTIAGIHVGTAQLFERSSGGWTLLNAFVPGDWGDQGTSEFGRFGEAVSIDGGSFLIGRPTDDEAASNAGAVYDFQASTLDTTRYCFCEAGVAPCGNFWNTGGCAAGLTGSGVRLEVVGNTSVASDGLVLAAGSLPLNTFALVFMGSTQPQVPFGNGLLCVGAGSTGLFRFPVQNTGNGDGFLVGPGLIAHAAANFHAGGQIESGKEWNFQLWYRDTGGACGSGFNTSNAVSAVFGN